MAKITMGLFHFVSLLVVIFNAMALSITPTKTCNFRTTSSLSNLHCIRSLGTPKAIVDSENQWSERDATWLKDANVIEYVLLSGP